MALFLLIIRIVMFALMGISAIVSIVSVMLMKSDETGISALSGSSSKNDSFYRRNKSVDKERLLKRIATISGIVLAVCSIAFFIFNKFV